MAAHHTKKQHRGGKMHLHSHKGHDGMAHSSHHGNHGEGAQKGMHGFGPSTNFTPGESYDAGGEESGHADCENTAMED